MGAAARATSLRTPPKPSLWPPAVAAALLHEPLDDPPVAARIEGALVLFVIEPLTGIGKAQHVCRWNGGGLPLSWQVDNDDGDELEDDCLARWVADMRYGGGANVEAEILAFNIDEAEVCSYETCFPGLG
jgi:hypothetical protein